MEDSPVEWPTVVRCVEQNKGAITLSGKGLGVSSETIRCVMNGKHFLLSLGLY